VLRRRDRSEWHPLARVGRKLRPVSLEDAWDELSLVLPMPWFGAKPTSQLRAEIAQLRAKKRQLVSDKRELAARIKVLRADYAPKIAAQKGRGTFVGVSCRGVTLGEYERAPNRKRVELAEKLKPLEKRIADLARKGAAIDLRIAAKQAALQAKSK
jgi:hypothetical protein